MTTDLPNIQSQQPSGIDYSAKITNTSLAFLNGQGKLNVVFDYSDLKIKGHPEKFFLTMQSSEWVQQWEYAKTSTFDQEFFNYLNKTINAKKTILLCGDYPDAQYQATVRVLRVERGWKVVCEVFFSKSDNTVPMAKVIVGGLPRKYSNFSGNNAYQTGTAFAYAGQNLGKYMGKKIK
jgi:hypothetical protein